MINISGHHIKRRDWQFGLKQKGKTQVYDVWKKQVKGKRWKRCIMV